MELTEQEDVNCIRVCHISSHFKIETFPKIGTKDECFPIKNHFPIGQELGQVNNDSLYMLGEEPRN